MKETTETLAAMQKSTEETIVIGSSYTYSKYMLELYSSTGKEHPRVQFEVVTDQSDALFRKLLDGRWMSDLSAAIMRALERIRRVGKAPPVWYEGTVKMEDLPGLIGSVYKTNDRTRDSGALVE